MKKLTLEQIEELIKDRLFSIKEDNNPCNVWDNYPSGEANYYPIKWAENNLTNYPEEFKQVYVDKNNNKVIVAPDFPELLNQSQLLNTTIKPLLLNWYEIHKTTLLEKNAIFSPESRQLQQKLALLGREIMSKVIIEIFDHDQLTNILNCGFWKFLYSPYKSKNPNNIIQNLAQLFENIDDVKTFSLILTKTYKDNFKISTMYKSWLKALMKFAKDYSLNNVPPMLFHKLNYNGSESNKIEVLKALRKYNYNEIKSSIVDLYINNNQTKVKQLVKEMLTENEYFTEKESRDIFLEENNSIIYCGEITLSFEALKNKSNDDILLAVTLLQLITQYIKEKNQYIKYEINYPNQIVKFALKHSNEDEIKNFKQNLLSYCDFAFGKDYLSTTTLELLSSRDRGTRIEHEKKPEVSNGFNKLLDLWLLKEKIDSIAPQKNDIEKRNKI